MSQTPGNPFFKYLDNAPVALKGFDRTMVVSFQNVLLLILSAVSTISHTPTDVVAVNGSGFPVSWTLGRNHLQFDLDVIFDISHHSRQHVDWHQRPAISPRLLQKPPNSNDSLEYSFSPAPFIHHHHNHHHQQQKQRHSSKLSCMKLLCLVKNRQLHLPNTHALLQSMLGRHLMKS
ncbi:unnamed protein product, partial [Mesocestoides corti]|uniref:Secreted protein n=1 Tax=Mesocestoides corti TaxID=53468 RepID=A0A0R3UCZ9_MESCO